MSTKETSLLNPIDSTIKDLMEDIIEETNPEKTKDLVTLFNWNMSKKNIARIQKLNDLYDAVTNQMVERVEQRADQFSNSDLLDYMKTIQGAIDVNTKNVSQNQDIPMIVQQTNNQVNINVVDTFDRAAKDRILAAVQATLNQATKISEADAASNTSVIDNRGEIK